MRPLLFLPPALADPAHAYPARYAFRLCELRNKETIIRIGGAITKIDMAGVEDQGRKVTTQEARKPCTRHM